MFRSEVPAEIIAAKVKMASAYCFDVSVGTIKQMRSLGVPLVQILNQMASLSAFFQRLWFEGYRRCA